MRRRLLLATLAALTAGCATRAPCAWTEAALTPGVCIALACPAGASATPAGRCACDFGHEPLFGACLAPREAELVCGLGQRSRAGRCEAPACFEGEAIDPILGACASALEVDRASGLRLEADEHARCRGERERRMRLPSGAFCVPPELACPRADVPHAGGCEAHPCAAGEALDALSGRCERVVSTSGDGAIVDVGAWVALVMGRDGGFGSHALCAPLELAGARPEFPMTLELAIDLAFPGSDVARASASVRVTSADNPRAIALGAPRESVESLLLALRRMSGVASAASVSTRVRCVLPALSRPRALRDASSAASPAVP